MAGNVGYLISKHAVLGLARAVAMEIAASGVRCNCINPGFIDTQMLAAVPPAALANMAARTPQGRVGKPEEVAGLVAYLSSEEAAFVTGANISINGGQHMY